MTVAELVAASRAAQGLPPRIEDPATLSRVASIIAAQTHTGQPDWAGSPPDRVGPVRPRPDGSTPRDGAEAGQA